MNRIEFLGPMGAGKSTIAKELVRSLNKNDSSILINDNQSEKRKIILEQIRDRSLVNYFFMKLLTIAPILNNSLTVNRIPSIAWSALENESNDIDAFVNAVLSIQVSSDTNTKIRLERTWKFIRELADIVFIDKYSSSDIVIFDESILQRGLGISTGILNEKQFIDSFCDTVPLPAMGLYVRADIETLTKRIKIRGREVDRLTNDLKVAVANGKKMVNKLKKRGLKIVEVDGLMDTGEVIEICIQEINKHFQNKNTAGNR